MRTKLASVYGAAMEKPDLRGDRLYRCYVQRTPPGPGFAIHRK